MDTDPRSSLLPDAPIEVLESRTLFRSSSIRRHGCGSLRRLASGRLLMAFMAGTGPEHVNDVTVKDAVGWEKQRDRGDRAHHEQHQSKERAGNVRRQPQ